jgi:dephospho-CoA kinase
MSSLAFDRFAVAPAARRASGRESLSRGATIRVLALDSRTGLRSAGKDAQIIGLADSRRTPHPTSPRKRGEESPGGTDLSDVDNMLLIGLTGSIGMGKSTTAQMFRDEGAPVCDSDELVHEIYRGPAAAEIERLFPGTVVAGAVDRSRLAERVVGDDKALERLEAIIHPLVIEARRKFIESHRNQGAKMVVLDVPLLFETGGDRDVDAVVVVSAAPEVQRARVLARPQMTQEKFGRLLARQIPDEEKRRRADFVVRTDEGLDFARNQVRAILAQLESRGASGADGAKP